MYSGSDVFLINKNNISRGINYGVFYYAYNI